MVLIDSKRSGFLNRHGLTRPIAWGFLAVGVFMVGDGLEAGFLAPLLLSEGFDVGQVSLMFAAYGATAAIAAFLSGGLAEAWGPKRVMMIGFGLWVILEVAFLVSLQQQATALMILSYALRGFAYPLFVFGFFAWITFVTEPDRMVRAAGWYWFFYLFGFGVVGAYFGAWAIPAIGEEATLWTSLIFVGVAGAIVLFLTRKVETGKVTLGRSLRAVVAGVSVLKTHPRVGVGGVIRLINSFSIFVFIALMGAYMIGDIGFSIEQWQSIFGTAFLANVLGNLLVGYLGSWFGELRIVMWLGCAGCVATCLAFYYVPAIVGPQFGIVMAVAVLWGLSVAGFIPISAIVPRLAAERKAAAVAILSLAASLSQVVASLIAALAAPFGFEAVIWILVATYVLAFVLSVTLRSAKELAAPSPIAAPSISA